MPAWAYGLLFVVGWALLLLAAILYVFWYDLRVWDVRAWWAGLRSRPPYREVTVQRQGVTVHFRAGSEVGEPLGVITEANIAPESPPANHYEQMQRWTRELNAIEARARQVMAEITRYVENYRCGIAPTMPGAQAVVEDTEDEDVEEEDATTELVEQEGRTYEIRHGGDPTALWVNGRIATAYWDHASRNATGEVLERAVRLAIAAFPETMQNFACGIDLRYVTDDTAPLLSMTVPVEEAPRHDVRIGSGGELHYFIHGEEVIREDP